MPTKRKKKAASRSTNARRRARAPNAAERKSATQELRPAAAFPIVGIGASAGGLAPFTELLEALPAASGMAFVIISHMDPAHESMLDTLLAKQSKMPLLSAKNGTAIKPDHVYVIQPDKYVTLKGGVLYTTERRKPGPVPTVIDHFFSSLARDRGADARGVVLSGIGSDGTIGLKLIHECGGITFAQEPHTAQFDSMPKSAIQSGCVDFVLPPRKIAVKLLRADRVVRHGALAEESPPEKGRDHFSEILAALFQSSGVDFSQYKMSTLRRRITRRMELKRLGSLPAYANYLRSHPEEIRALYKESLIHVSSFFRDHQAFRALERTVLQPLANAPRAEPIRVWVPGCARGEEVYTIGMLLLEQLGTGTNRRRVQLFGTDISAPDIDAARIGRYPAAVIAAIAPERRKRFFIKVGDAYQVIPELRELCVFACHDVGSDPPFSKLDLVSCRNTLIYFARALQDHVIETFHYALKPGGHLFLGRSESLSGQTNLFALTNKKHRIYTRKPGNSHLAVHAVLPQFFGATTETPRIARRSPLPPSVSGAKAELRQQLDRLLIERYAPPGLYLDQSLQILSFHGDVSPYLRPSSGQADFHLSKMLAHDVALDIRTAIASVRKSQRPAHRESIHVAADGISQGLNLTVMPVHRGPESATGYLVLFEPVKQDGAAPKIAKPSSRRERNELQRANTLLASTREQLRTVIDEQENSLHELTTAQEELLSSNEELQSSNEELETAKEELQSGNEELTTVNEELRKRNEDLDRLTGELGNLIAGVNIPIVNLDRERNVLRFSPAAKAAFHLIDADVGRSFDHIKAPLAEPNLDELIVRALERGEAVEREVEDRSGRWQLLRIRPYKTSSNRIDGVLIALVDIDRIKRRAAAIVETIHEPLLVLDTQMRVIFVNPAFCKTFKVSVLDAEGVSIFKLAHQAWDIPALHALLKDVLPRHKRFEGFRVEHEFAGIGRKIFLLSGQQVFDAGVGTNTVLIVFQDVTDRESKSLEIQTGLTNRLREEKEQTEKRVAHELHDISSQGFASLNIELARLATRVRSAPREVEQGMRVLAARVSALAQSTHELARRLHPSVLDDLGLVKALKAECQAFKERTAIPVRYQATALPKKLPESLALCLYRVAQEALRNVAGHAQATQADVTLRRARQRVTLSVHDNGIGFDSAAARATGGLGLVSIAERVAAVGGTTSIDSKRNKGTTITVSVPWDGSTKASRSLQG
jgi:two-component system CheB/CheR fusion protein